MSKVLIEEQALHDIADAVRARTGDDTAYKPGEMASAIINHAAFYDCTKSDWDAMDESEKTSYYTALNRQLIAIYDDSAGAVHMNGVINLINYDDYLNGFIIACDTSKRVSKNDTDITLSFSDSYGSVPDGGYTIIILLINNEASTKALDGALLKTNDDTPINTQVLYTCPYNYTNTQVRNCAIMYGTGVSISGPLKLDVSSFSPNANYVSLYAAAIRGAWNISVPAAWTAADKSVTGDVCGFDTVTYFMYGCCRTNTGPYFFSTGLVPNNGTQIGTDDPSTLYKSSYVFGLNVAKHIE